MEIELLADKLRDELPGYKLIGYVELGVPIYRRTLYCSMLTDQTVGVVEEFVLRFYSLGVELSTITQIMGLDNSLIEQAWWRLIDYEFISFTKKTITDVGQDYLDRVNRKIIETRTFQVDIDGLTGVISKSGSSLMNNKNVKNLGVNVIPPQIEMPTCENIDFYQVKRVVRQYGEMDNEQSGELLDVFDMKGNGTYFKRIKAFVYSNDDNTRYIIYDSNNRIEEYEGPLINHLAQGKKVVGPVYGEYFNANGFSEFENLFESNKKLNVGEIWTQWKNNFLQAQSSVLISLPLISIFTPSAFLINEIEKLLQRKIAVHLLVTGRPFVNEYQKKQFKQLLDIQKKYSNFTSYSYPVYLNKMLIIVNQYAVVSFIKKEQCEPSDEAILEYGYLFNKNSHGWSDILALYTKYEKLNQPVPGNKKWVKEKISTIISLAEDVNEYMQNINSDIGWFNSTIPEVYALNELPLASNQDKFKIFVTVLNKSFVEVIDDWGRANGRRSYFWQDFKTNYPDLQKALDRIRVYRNDANHFKLNDQNKKKYFDFLDEDIDGALPQFIPNSYLILQHKILSELEKVLRQLINS